LSDAIAAQVLDANSRFYAAFEALDIDAVEDCWEKSSRAACVHPGSRWVTGWTAVQASLEGMLSNIDYIEFEVLDLNVSVEDPVAMVTCVERVSSTAGSGRATLDVCATNIFVLSSEGWKLVLHHASPIMQPSDSEGEAE
jgi:ketosteroid isomerase-like protein